MKRKANKTKQMNRVYDSAGQNGIVNRRCPSVKNWNVTPLSIEWEIVAYKQTTIAQKAISKEREGDWLTVGARERNAKSKQWHTTESEAHIYTHIAIKCVCERMNVCTVYSRFNVKCNSPPTLKPKTMTCASVFTAWRVPVYVVHMCCTHATDIYAGSWCVGVRRHIQKRRIFSQPKRNQWKELRRAFR